MSDSGRFFQQSEDEEPWPDRRSPSPPHDSDGEESSALAHNPFNVRRRSGTGRSPVLLLADPLIKSYERVRLDPPAPGEHGQASRRVTHIPPELKSIIAFHQRSDVLEAVMNMTSPAHTPFRSAFDIEHAVDNLQVLLDHTAHMTSASTLNDFKRFYSIKYLDIGGPVFINVYRAHQEQRPPSVALWEMLAKEATEKRDKRLIVNGLRLDLASGDSLNKWLRCFNVGSLVMLMLDIWHPLPHGGRDAHKSFLIPQTVESLALRFFITRDRYGNALLNRGHIGLSAIDVATLLNHLASEECARVSQFHLSIEVDPSSQFSRFLIEDFQDHINPAIIQLLESFPRLDTLSIHFRSSLERAGPSDSYEFLEEKPLKHLGSLMEYRKHFSKQLACQASLLSGIYSSHQRQTQRNLTSLSLDDHPFTREDGMSKSQGKKPVGTEDKEAAPRLSLILENHPCVTPFALAQSVAQLAPWNGILLATEPGVPTHELQNQLYKHGTKHRAEMGGLYDYQQAYTMHDFPLIPFAVDIGYGRGWLETRETPTQARGGGNHS